MRLLISILLIAVIGIASAQTPVNTHSIRYFATQQVEQKLYKEDSVAFELKKATDASIDQKVSQGVMINKRVVPVVFHILGQEYSPALQEEFVAQLAAINQIFSLESIVPGNFADSLMGFYNLHQKADLEFCLAQKDPDDNITSGLKFYPAITSEWGASNDLKNPLTGGVAPWRTEYYLNIWVADLEGDLAGFAQMPGGPSATDGIVLAYDFIGPRANNSPQYAMGKTLIHLLGSYLGLYELWSDYVTCADDKVSDTPIHNGPNFGKHPYKEYSFCSPPQVEMTVNFMDCSDDVEQTLFTFGQVIRMHSTLEGPRSNLGISNKCGGVEIVNGIGEPSADQNQMAIKVHPIPTSGNLIVELETSKSEMIKLEIIDALGRLVYTPKDFMSLIGTNVQVLDCELLAPGLYWVVASAKNKRVYHKISKVN